MQNKGFKPHGKPKINFAVTVLLFIEYFLNKY